MPKICDIKFDDGRTRLIGVNGKEVNFCPCCTWYFESPQTLQHHYINKHAFLYCMDCAGKKNGHNGISGFKKHCEKSPKQHEVGCGECGKKIGRPMHPGNYGFIATHLKACQAVADVYCQDFFTSATAYNDHTCNDHVHVARVAKVNQEDYEERNRKRVQEHRAIQAERDREFYARLRQIQPRPQMMSDEELEILRERQEDRAFWRRIKEEDLRKTAEIRRQQRLNPPPETVYEMVTRKQAEDPDFNEWDEYARLEREEREAEDRARPAAPPPQPRATTKAGRRAQVKAAGIEALRKMYGIVPALEREPDWQEQVRLEIEAKEAAEAKARAEKLAEKQRIQKEIELEKLKNETPEEKKERQEKEEAARKEKERIIGAAKTFARMWKAQVEQEQKDAMKNGKILPNVYRYPGYEEAM
ncbi:hypothetical protein TWF694_001017 [Orbilia ellipsospora]|uniref:C2H2-type domain-containing protein n=1 Tax=Orbilia ellipsospora TaxID=2528407 RepID=A0AAV9XRZ8_9PEZI